MRAPKWLLWLVGPLVGMSRDFVNHSVGLPGPEFSSAKAQKELGLTFIDFQVGSVLYASVCVCGGVPVVLGKQGGRGGCGGHQSGPHFTLPPSPGPLPLAPAFLDFLVLHSEWCGGEGEPAIITPLPHC